MHANWPWPSKSFGHFNSEFQATAFNVTLVHWARPTKGYYTSQPALVLCGSRQIIFNNLTFLHWMRRKSWHQQTLILFWCQHHEIHIFSSLCFRLCDSYPCGIQCHGLTTCPHYVGPLFGKSFLNELVWNFNIAENSFSISCISILREYTLIFYLNILVCFIFRLLKYFHIAIDSLIFCYLKRICWLLIKWKHPIDETPRHDVHIKLRKLWKVNSLRPSDACMRQQTNQHWLR